YEVAGVAPGRWRVVVDPLSPLVAGVRSEVVLSSGEAREVEHRLAPAGVLQFLGEADARFGLRRAGSDDLVTVFETRRDGTASVPAPTGRLEIVALEGLRAVMAVGTVDGATGAPTFIGGRRGCRVA